MEEFSKHLIIFLYMLAFFSGISSLTILWIFSKRGLELFGESYTAQKRFITVFFGFFVINFLIYYNKYFTLNEPARIVLLIFFDIFFILIIYYCFKANYLENMKKAQWALASLGILYVALWMGTYILNYGSFSIWGVPLALVADILFYTLAIGLLLFCARQQWKDNHELPERRYLITLNLATALYICTLYIMDIYDMLKRISNNEVSVSDPYFWDPVLVVFLLVNTYTIVRLVAKLNEANVIRLASLDGRAGADEQAQERFCSRFGLSVREREIAALVAEGRTNPEMAEALSISLYTVKRHMNNIFRKTGAKNRFELICWIREA